VTLAKSRVPSQTFHEIQKEWSITNTFVSLFSGDIKILIINHVGEFERALFKQ
jgi:hypothetical protein